MFTKQPKNVVIVMGTNEEEVHNTYMFLSKEGFTAWLNKMCGLGFSVSVNPKEADKAMDVAINYCIAHEYDSMICVTCPTQKIKDIRENRENTL